MPLKSLGIPLALPAGVNALVYQNHLRSFGKYYLLDMYRMYFYILETKVRWRHGVIVLLFPFFFQLWMLHVPSKRKENGKQLYWEMTSCWHQDVLSWSWTLKMRPFCNITQNLRIVFEPGSEVRTTLKGREEHCFLAPGGQNCVIILFICVPCHTWQREEGEHHCMPSLFQLLPFIKFPRIG